MIAVNVIGALVARTLMDNIQQTRTTVLVIAGVMLVIGFIVVAVMHNEEGLQLSGWEAASFFALPAFAIYCLVGPKSIRDALGPIITPSTTGYASAPASAGPFPGQPPQQGGYQPPGAGYAPPQGPPQ